MHQVLIQYSGVLLFLFSLIVFSISYWIFTLLNHHQVSPMEIAIKSSLSMTISLYLLMEVFRFMTTGFKWIGIDLIGSAFYVASVVLPVFVLWYAFFNKGEYRYAMRVGIILYIFINLYSFQSLIQEYFKCCEGLAGFMLMVNAVLGTVFGAIAFVIGGTIVYLIQLLIKYIKN